MARQRRDHEPAAIERVAELAARFVAGEELGGFAGPGTPVVAGPDLDRLEPEVDDLVEHLLEPHGPEDRVEHADLHAFGRSGSCRPSAAARRITLSLRRT